MDAGTEGEVVRDKNLIEIIEMENINIVRGKIIKEKRFLDLNKVPIFKLEGSNVC